MNLSQSYAIEHTGLPPRLFELPERVLQFGTGVLLRGLSDYLIDKANKEGIFGGRVLVVKTTGTDVSEFAAQESLYTLHERGLDADGNPVDQHTVIAALSRVIPAATHWQELLEAMHSPELEIILSNTTEVGLQYVEEDIFAHPPQSFPAKLTAMLYERFRFFEASPAAGMVIVPTELIVNNGTLLGGWVQQHARRHQLPQEFLDWLAQHCHFCNSLVDRIVPGAPPAAEREGLYPYEDALSIRSEPFLLWAIEGGPEVARKLSFAQADSRLVIAPDITPFREQKLRILNGGHTISVCLAYLLGLRSVGQMMAHPEMGLFVERVMMQEIEPTLGFDAKDFARAVLARFRNPYIEHRLLSITLQCSSKMRQRNAETLIRYQRLRGEIPPLMCLGLAAWLLFTRPVGQEKGGWTAADPEGQPYPLNDDFAPFFHEQWAALPDTSENSLIQLVQHVWANEALTDPGLREYPEIAASVARRLWELIHLGPAQTLKQLLPS